MTDGIASGYDRFAAWPKTAARAALLALVALLVASAIVPIRAAEQKIATVTLAQQIRGETGTPRPRDDDLALYDRVIERIGKGENYYTVAAEEHRRSHYPLRPGVAVRLPTLAYLLAWLAGRSRPRRCWSWRFLPRGGGGWAKNRAARTAG